VVFLGMYSLSFYSVDPILENIFAILILALIYSWKYIITGLVLFTLAWLEVVKDSAESKHFAAKTGRSAHNVPQDRWELTGWFILYLMVIGILIP